MRSRRTIARRKTAIVKSSGNVFTDLRIPNAEEKQTKVRLAVAINHILAERQLSQTRPARQLGINQPKVSALSHYHLDGFSVERLLHFLGGLGRDIEIVIRPKPRSRKSSKILVSAETHHQGTISLGVIPTGAGQLFLPVPLLRDRQ